MEQKRIFKQIFLLAAFLLVGYWALQNLDVVSAMFNWIFTLIMPFLVGCAIAFILHVPMGFFAKKIPQNVKKGRTALSFIISLLCGAIIISIAMGIIVPQLVKTISEIALALPAFGQEVLVYLTNIANQYPFLEPAIAEWAQVNWQSIVEEALAFLSTSGITLITNVFSAASGIFNGVINSIVSVIFAIYILFNGENLKRQGKMLLYAFFPKNRAERVIEITIRSEKAFSNFLTGQCLEACILGAIVAAVMFLFGMPYIPLVGVLVAFTALIPLVGAFLGCFIGAFLILLENPVQALIFVVLFVVIQQLEGNLIYPRVVGSSIGLPSMWVLVAITFGGGVGGVAGMLIMIPLCSVLYSLLCETVYVRLHKRGMGENFLKERNSALEMAKPQKATKEKKTKNKK